MRRGQLDGVGEALGSTARQPNPFLVFLGAAPGSNKVLGAGGLRRRGCRSRGAGAAREQLGEGRGSHQAVASRGSCGVRGCSGDAGYALKESARGMSFPGGSAVEGVRCGPTFVWWRPGF